MSRRYDLQPLLDVTGLSLSALRAMCPMSGHTYRNARTVGLTADQADTYAVRCGFHPSLIWPDWFDAAWVACADCAGRFVPVRRGHRFCSVTCRRRATQRAWTRRKYADDPAFVAAEKARAAAYYAACRGYVRRRQNEQRQAARDAA